MPKADLERSRKGQSIGAVTLNGTAANTEADSSTRSAVETALSVRGLTARVITYTGSYVKIKWFLNNKPYTSLKLKSYTQAVALNYINDYADEDGLTGISSLASNGDFETNTTGWTGTNTTVARDTTQYRTGVASMKLTPTTNAITVATTVTTVVSSNYTVRAWIKGTKGAVAYAKVGATNLGNVTLSGDWDAIVQTFTATATSTSVEIHSDANTNPIYVDSVAIRLT